LFTAFPAASERAPGCSGVGLIGRVGLLTIMFSLAKMPMSVLMRRTASVHFMEPVDTAKILRMFEEISGEKVRRISPFSTPNGMAPTPPDFLQTDAREERRHAHET
jgi:hypothetical protein